MRTQRVSWTSPPASTTRGPACLGCKTLLLSDSLLVHVSRRRSALMTWCAVLRQAEAYSVMAQPIVEALTYFSALSFDVMSFVLIERLAASGRPKIKEDGINISDWLQVRPHSPPGLLPECCLLCEQGQLYCLRPARCIQTLFSSALFDGDARTRDSLHLPACADLPRPRNSLMWMQALCVFTGRACLACDKVDVSSICQYVADSYDLLVLRSIVEDMTVGQLHLSAERPL